VGHAFDRCTACSKSVLLEYLRSGFEFVKRVCNEPNMLEELTGLHQLKKDAAEISFDWVDDDDE
jgi:ubiquitin-like modifier-activating enzyme ATG7